MTNPYAPPGQHDAGYIPPYGAQAQGAPLPWQLEEVVRHGWETVKREPILIVVQLIVLILPNVFSRAPDVLKALNIFEPNHPVLLLVTAVMAIAGALVGWFLQVGQVRLFLAATRNQPVRFEVLFSGIDRFLPFAGMAIVSSLAMGVGFLLLIVPGVILAIGFSLAKYYVIEQEKGVIESLQASWEATRGNKGDLFVFMLVYAALIIGGLCACGIGIFITMPLAEIALAAIYLRRSGEATPLAGQVTG